jgi:hypothetical protein
MFPQNKENMSLQNHASFLRMENEFCMNRMHGNIHNKLHYPILSDLQIVISLAQ